MNSQYGILAILLSLDSRQSTNQLVETCYKIALSNLRFSYKKVHQIVLREELSLEDLAIDSIASLFEKDESGSFQNVIGPFNSWQPP
ncbi:MAG: hypothetical protein HXY49_10470, partial [Ignavibacteriaceae bacterium]|nr:hypothetical protein [Ignavibacteriaceae bacterium]